ncbi:hypothetical protein FR932_00035 (plasmid) [Moritella marina ATCC 15381]|uniref:Uncharacterized protein n=1 Tax=Moritella marina ATCC 15381 TaxID=1202962 RepID=A0A5J6WFM9_MORMI|nr:hypothetical protein [Moritella marina]QFI36314.1 hypothetical protein FR932_00035 [Moritella marina ATCC 15381]
MRNIYRNSYIKTLTAAEINSNVSHQHELHGVLPLTYILGKDDLRKIPVNFIMPSINLTVSGTITWYDSRRNQSHRSPEYRFYYTDNEVMRLANTGDNIQIAVTQNGDLDVIVHTNVQHQYNTWTEE